MIFNSLYRIYWCLVCKIRHWLQIIFGLSDC